MVLDNLCNQSQTVQFTLHRLGFMAIKYYTHFVLTGSSVDGNDQEYSGVVEVNHPTDEKYAIKDIEALLASNFDLQSGEVRLLNWARLQ